MLRPVNINSVPKNGWTVTIEGAAPEIVSDHFSDLIKKAHTRLEANGMASHGWRERVIHEMCKQRPDIQCEDDELPPSRVATSDDAIRFLKTLWIAMKDGAQPVSEEEQDRRASICLQCPKRGVVNCYGGCGTIAGLMADLVIGSKSKRIPELFKQHCTCCGCELSSLTTYPIEVLAKVDADINFQSSEYPVECWKRQGIEKIQGENEPDSSAQPAPLAE